MYLPAVGGRSGAMLSIVDLPVPERSMIDTCSPKRNFEVHCEDPKVDPSGRVTVLVTPSSLMKDTQPFASEVRALPAIGAPRRGVGFSLRVAFFALWCELRTESIAQSLGDFDDFPSVIPSLTGCLVCFLPRSMQVHVVLVGSARLRHGSGAPGLPVPKRPPWSVEGQGNRLIRSNHSLPECHRVFCCCPSSDFCGFLWGHDPRPEQCSSWTVCDRRASLRLAHFECGRAGRHSGLRRLREVEGWIVATGR